MFSVREREFRMLNGTREMRGYDEPKREVAQSSDNHSLGTLYVKIAQYVA